MEAVILASGEGRRLKSITGDTPKCFYPVENIPLFIYGVKALARIGIKRYVIVVRKGFTDIASEFMEREGIEKYKIVENQRPELGSAYSLILGLKETREEKSFIACCDTIAPPSFYRKIIGCVLETKCDICVGGSRDSRFIDFKEASKIVMSASNNVVFIGKNIDKADLIDVGLMVIPRKAIDYQVVVENSEKETHLYQLIQLMSREGYSVKACDLGFKPWIEVDEPSDLNVLTMGKGREILEIYWKEMAE